MAVSLTLTASANANSTGSVTFSSLSLGTSAADRIIVALVYSTQGSSSITGVTIQSVSANLQFSSTTARSIGVYTAAVPNSSTGDVTVTTNLTSNGTIVALLRLTGADSPTPSVMVSTGIGGTDLSDDITIFRETNGGALVAANTNSTATVLTWTNATAVSSNGQATAVLSLSAHTGLVTSTGSITVTASYNGVTRNVNMVAASWIESPPLTITPSYRPIIYDSKSIILSY